MVKVFLKNCLLFSFFPMLLVVLFEIVVRQLPNPYTDKYVWMKNHAQEVETIILGNSHAMYGIKPNLMDGKTYNLAFESQVPAYDYFLLNYFAQDYKKLKTVILPISFFTLFQRFEDMPSWWKSRYYHLYMDCDFHPYSFFYNFEIGHYPSALEKAGAFVEKLIEKKDLRLVDDTGWSFMYSFSERDTSMISNMENVQTIIKRHVSEDWTYVDEIVSSVNNIVKFCRARKIDLILITTPTWKSYYENLPPKQYERMHQLIDSICTKNNLPYLDYLKDDRFVYDDFYDCDHLNNIGAEKFTKILNHDIRSLKNK